MDKITEILADNLKLIRKEAGLTQEGLAEKAGVSLFTIQAMESSRRWPESSTIDKVARALEVDQGELFSSGRVTTMNLETALNVLARAHGFKLVKE